MYIQTLKNFIVGDDAHIVPKPTGGNVPLKRKHLKNPTFRGDVGIAPYSFRRSTYKKTRANQGCGGILGLYESLFGLHIQYSMKSVFALLA